MLEMLDSVLDGKLQSYFYYKSQYKLQSRHQ